VCVHIPSSTDSAPGSDAEPNAHFDKHGRWVVYDQIPRRPDRPADYDAYRYPVPCSHGCVLSGYDLDRPDESQRRGRHLTFVGHGGVDLVQPRGTPIAFVPLDHQEGDAEVVYVGPLYGTTVLARSTVREGQRLRDYILLFGHLEAPAAGLSPHSLLRAGDVVGAVGDTGSPELVHLHLEARRVRDGVDLFKLGASGAGAILASENSVVCDPRNVLPVR
jgi:murein DD-endopeptidase MepM/ murein hydrolase activator NlpD